MPADRRKNLIPGAGTWHAVAPAKDETDKEWLALLETVGESLAQLRRNQGWSLRELCNLLGYHRDSGMVTNLEKGRTPGVMLHRIWRTANVLGYRTRIVFEKKERR